ncbi:MAG: hypothetical protein ACP5OP_06985 [Leptospirillia bacterium]
MTEGSLEILSVLDILLGQEQESIVEAPCRKIEGLVPDEPDPPRMAGQEIFRFGSGDTPQFEEFSGSPTFMTKQGSPERQSLPRTPSPA